MTLRNVVPLALSTLTLCSVGSAFAQAPFTIRRPPDGATVREQVRIEIPRASIKPGGFVAFYIDDKFHSATAPQETAAGGGAGKPFAFVWDTKEGSVTDGEHTIRAVLFEPAAGDRSNAVAVEEKESSEVKLTVANKIKNGPKSLTLRYKYRNGAVMEYARNAKSMVVGGLSSSGITTSDQTLNEMKSKLLIGIEDSRPAEDIALVRNKLTSLSILEQGSEVTIPESQLSGSMYQELNSQGRVMYETPGSGLSLTDFSERGVSVNNTLELPLMPLMQVSTGQTWRLPGQRLDIPGLSSNEQPKVTLTSKFEGLEWESGYPTAKIRQTYEGDYGKVLTFNGVEVTTPKVNYERDIYIAYKSGTLVKIKRTLTVSGRTSSELGAPPEVGGGGGSSFGNRMSGGGMTGPMTSGGLSGASGGSRGPYSGGPPAGAGGPYGGMSGGPGGRGGSGSPYGGMIGGPGGRGGSGGRPGSGSPYGGGPPGYGGPPSGGSGSPYGGMMSGGRRGGGKMGGMAGEGGPPPGAPYGGMMTGGRMGAMTGSARSGGMGGAGTQETDHPITLRSVTETQILPDSNKAQ